MDLLKNIVLVILSPRAGWNEVNESAISTQRLLSNVFLPLLALLAVTSFVPMFYNSSLTLSASLMTAIIKFTGYYITYYLTAFLLGGTFPDLVKGAVATDRMNDYVMYNLIYLVLLEIIKNLLPVEFAPIFFMMFYMPYIAYKGTEYLGVKNDIIWKFTVMASLIMLLMPQFIILVFGYVIH